MGSGLNFIGPPVLPGKWEKAWLERWLFCSVCHCFAGLVLLHYFWFFRLKQEPGKRRGLPASKGFMSSVSGTSRQWLCCSILKTSKNGGPTNSLGPVPGLHRSHREEPCLCAQPISLVPAAASCPCRVPVASMGHARWVSAPSTLSSRVSKAALSASPPQPQPSQRPFSGVSSFSASPLYSGSKARCRNACALKRQHYANRNRFTRN